MRGSSRATTVWNRIWKSSSTSRRWQTISLAAQLWASGHRESSVSVLPVRSRSSSPGVCSRRRSRASIGRPLYSSRVGIHAALCSATPSLCLHRMLVPEPDQVPVGIDELGSVAPVGLARAMGELDSSCGPVRERGVHIGDLKPQSALVWHDGRGYLLKKDREAVAVLKRDR